MSQFSNDEEGSPWVDFNEESAMNLIQLNSNHFIEISDGEDSNCVSIINLPRVFLSVRKGTHKPVSSNLLTFLRTRETRKTRYMQADAF